jgi:hypothetical protein
MVSCGAGLYLTSRADTWTTAVLVDELDAGSLECPLEYVECSHNKNIKY